MFDFLYSEEFWMETFLISLGAIAVTLLTAYIAAWPKLGKVNSDLSKEHSDILIEYKVISGKQDLLLDRSKDIQAIRETQIVDIAKREGNYAQLDTAQQLLVNSASTIGKFSDEFARLVAENKALRTEVQQLKEENAQLRADIEPEDNGPEFG